MSAAAEQVESAQATIQRWREGGPALFAQEAMGATPTDQQTQGSRELVARRRVSVRSGHGCFGIGTQIMLSNGQAVPVESVRVGDRLMGADGNSIRNVLELRRGREAMYKFTYMDGSSHVFNESHILCLVATNSKGLRKTGEKRTTTVRDWLTWGEDKRRCHAVYRSGVFEYERSVKLPIPPYLFGTWLGDGTSADTAVTTADPEVLSAWTRYANSIGCSLMKAATKGAAATYKISVARGKKNPMRDALRLLGVFRNKYVPDDYLLASFQERQQILAGLIDTDGSFSKASFDFIQKNEQIANSVVRLAKSIGCHATVKPARKVCVNNGVAGDYFRVTISRNLSLIPTRIPRKQAGKGEQQRQNLHFGIREVESLGIGDYYGFILDGDSRFLGADHTVLHNTGKSTFEAWCILWFQTCFFPCRVPCTAPTGHQLNDVLWAEVAKWHRVLKERMPDLAQEFEWTAEKFSLKAAPSESFAVARTSRPERPEALQGFHSENLLFLIDEASGIPEEVFQVAEGALSTPGAYVFMAANPTRMDGYFFDSHHKMRDQWSALWWNGEESPLVAKEYVAEMKAKYGEDSAIYRIRVRGEFAGNPDGVISLAVIEGAIDRDVRPFGEMIWGVDVARFGEDRTALAKRQGNTMPEAVKWWHGKDTMQVAGLLKLEYDAAKIKPVAINVDVIGLGAGVVDRCKELGLPVVGVNVAESPSIKDQYNRLRDELWFECRDWFHRRDVRMAADDALIAELTLPSFKVLSSGKKQVEGKDDMKKRGVTSPDLADAFCLTFAKGIAKKEWRGAIRYQAQGTV